MTGLTDQKMDDTPEAADQNRTDIRFYKDFTQYSHGFM